MEDQVKKRIAIINGPNLNLIGKREPEIYGDLSFADYLVALREQFPEMEISYFQSNHEGDLIDHIQEMGYDDRIEGIIMNPGAYAHYSYAIADAIRSISVPVVEVHISNIYAREEFRRQSVTASACSGVITGLGLRGYSAAINYFINHGEESLREK